MIGKLRTSSYERDGVKRYTTDILADQVELAGGRSTRDTDRAPSLDDRAPGLDSDDDLTFG